MKVFSEINLTSKSGIIEKKNVQSLINPKEFICLKSHFFSTGKDSIFIKVSSNEIKMDIVRNFLFDNEMNTDQYNLNKTFTINALEDENTIEIFHEMVFFTRIKEIQFSITFFSEIKNEVFIHVIQFTETCKGYENSQISSEKIPVNGNYRLCNVELISNYESDFNTFCFLLEVKNYKTKEIHIIDCLKYCNNKILKYVNSISTSSILSKLKDKSSLLSSVFNYLTSSFIKEKKEDAINIDSIKYINNNILLILSSTNLIVYRITDGKIMHVHNLYNFTDGNGIVEIVKSEIIAIQSDYKKQIFNKNPFKQYLVMIYLNYLGTDNRMKNIIESVSIYFSVDVSKIDFNDELDYSTYYNHLDMLDITVTNKVSQNIEGELITSCVYDGKIWLVCNNIPTSKKQYHYDIKTINYNLIDEDLKSIQSKVHYNEIDFHSNQNIIKQIELLSDEIEQFELISKLIFQIVPSCVVCNVFNELENNILIEIDKFLSSYNNTSLLNTNNSLYDFNVYLNDKNLKGEKNFKSMLMIANEYEGKEKVKFFFEKILLILRLKSLNNNSFNGDNDKSILEEPSRLNLSKLDKSINCELSIIRKITQLCFNYLYENKITGIGSIGNDEVSGLYLQRNDNYSIFSGLGILLSIEKDITIKENMLRNLLVDNYSSWIKNTKDTLKEKKYHLDKFSIFSSANNSQVNEFNFNWKKVDDYKLYFAYIRILFTDTFIRLSDRSFIRDIIKNTTESLDVKTITKLLVQNSTHCNDKYLSEIKSELKSMSLNNFYSLLLSFEKLYNEVRESINSYEKNCFEVESKEGNSKLIKINYNIIELVRSLAEKKIIGCLNILRDICVSIEYIVETIESDIKLFENLYPNIDDYYENLMQIRKKCNATFIQTIFSYYISISTVEIGDKLFELIDFDISESCVSRSGLNGVNNVDLNKSRLSNKSTKLIKSSKEISLTYLESIILKNFKNKGIKDWSLLSSDYINFILSQIWLNENNVENSILFIKNISQKELQNNSSNRLNNKFFVKKQDEIFNDICFTLELYNLILANKINYEDRLLFNNTSNSQLFENFDIEDCSQILKIKSSNDHNNFSENFFNKHDEMTKKQKINKIKLNFARIVYYLKLKKNDKLQIYYQNTTAYNLFLEILELLSEINMEDFNKIENFITKFSKIDSIKKHSSPVFYCLNVLFRCIDINLIGFDYENLRHSNFYKMLLKNSTYVSYLCLKINGGEENKQGLHVFGNINIESNIDQIDFELKFLLKKLIASSLLKLDKFHYLEAFEYIKDLNNIVKINGRNDTYKELIEEITSLSILNKLFVSGVMINIKEKYCKKIKNIQYDFNEMNNKLNMEYEIPLEVILEIYLELKQNFIKGNKNKEIMEILVYLSLKCGKINDFVNMLIYHIETEISLPLNSTNKVFSNSDSYSFYLSSLSNMIKNLLLIMDKQKTTLYHTMINLKSTSLGKSISDDYSIVKLNGEKLKTHYDKLNDLVDLKIALVERTNTLNLKISTHFIYELEACTNIIDFDSNLENQKALIRFAFYSNMLADQSLLRLTKYFDQSTQFLYLINLCQTLKTISLNSSSSSLENEYIRNICSSMIETKNKMLFSKFLYILNREDNDKQLMNKVISIFENILS